MAEPATVDQVLQWGIEATEAAAVAATKRLLSFDAVVGPGLTNKAVQGRGYKTPLKIVRGREWSEVDLTADTLSFNDMAYLLSAAVAKVTPTQITTPSGLAYTWPFSPVSTQQDAVQTFTLENGDAVEALQLPGMYGDGWSLNWSREVIQAKGTLMGQALVAGHALTSGGVTEVPLIPADPNLIDIFLDTAAAGLGTTRQLSVLDGVFTVPNHRAQVWALNSALPGYKGRVEQRQATTLQLTWEANAEGFAAVAQMRANNRVFIRVHFGGPLIETGNSYGLTLDVSAEVSNIGKEADSGGVVSLPVTFTAVHDPTWGKAYTISLTNTLSTL